MIGLRIAFIVLLLLAYTWLILRVIKFGEYTPPSKNAEEHDLFEKTRVAAKKEVHDAFKKARVAHDAEDEIMFEYNRHLKACKESNTIPSKYEFWKEYLRL